MSLQTAAIIPAHVTIGELCAALRKIDGIANVGARQMTRPEYQLIEFLCGNRRSAIHVFLASYAADDYADVVTGESTLLTIEASPYGKKLLAHLAGSGGWVRGGDGEAWQPVLSV